MIRTECYKGFETTARHLLVSVGRLTVDLGLIYCGGEGCDRAVVRVIVRWSDQRSWLAEAGGERHHLIADDDSIYSTWWKPCARAYKWRWTPEPT
jgi:hypothetical protein